MPTSLAVAELQVRDGGVLLLLDGTESSWIDLGDPTHLDFEYHQQMDAALGALWGEGPLRAVHLGGAGCALARAWDASRPGSTQTAVEVDAVLADRVRQWFDLPRSPRLRIRVGDAAQVVPHLRGGQWDVVVRDVFAAGRVPPRCATTEFLAACRAALAPRGLYLANVACPPRERAGDAAVVRGRRPGNLVVVARAEPLTSREARAVERAVRRLPLPVRTWEVHDPALPQG